MSKRILVILSLFLSIPLFAKDKAFERVPSMASEGNASVVEVSVPEDAIFRDNFSFEIGSKSYSATVTKREWRDLDIYGDFILQFRVKGAEYSSTLTYHGGATAMTVFDKDGSSFAVIPSRDGYEIVGNGVSSCQAVPVMRSKDFVAESSAYASRKRLVSRIPPTPVEATIDLMEWYTPAALAGAGSEANLRATIQNRVDYLNMVVANSGITNFKFRLIYVGLFNHNESGSQSKILQDFADSQEIRLLREKFGGDMAGLWTEAGTATAWIDWIFYPGGAFHVVGRTAQVSTFAHEVGHNAGMQHNSEQADYTGANDLYPYAKGWYSVPGNWTTVMSYMNPCIACPRIPHFSNPDILYNGIPTGVKDKADNARMLRFSGPQIMNYYPSQVQAKP